MAVIAKGCTVKNTFTFPYKAENIENIYVTYCQSAKCVFEKEACDCSIEDGKVTIHLSQEETLKFDTSKTIHIQMRVKFKNGSATKSNIIEASTDRVLKKEVI